MTDYLTRRGYDVLAPGCLDAVEAALEADRAWAEKQIAQFEPHADIPVVARILAERKAALAATEQLAEDLEDGDILAWLTMRRDRALAKAVEICPSLAPSRSA